MTTKMWAGCTCLFYFIWIDYEKFHDGWWGDMYVRPPFIDGTKDETNMVGHWRRKRDVI